MSLDPPERAGFEVEDLPSEVLHPPDATRPHPRRSFDVADLPATPTREQRCWQFAERVVTCGKRHRCCETFLFQPLPQHESEP